MPYTQTAPSGTSDVSYDPPCAASLMPYTQGTSIRETGRGASVSAAYDSAQATCDLGAGYQASALGGPDRKPCRRKLRNGSTFQRKKVPSSTVTSAATGTDSPSSSQAEGVSASSSCSSVPFGIHRFTDTQAVSAFDNDVASRGAAASTNSVGDIGTASVNGERVIVTSLEQSKYGADERSSFQFQTRTYTSSQAAPLAPAPASSMASAPAHDGFVGIQNGQESDYAIGPALMQSLDPPAQDTFPAQIQQFSAEGNFLQQQQNYYPVNVSVASSSSSSSPSHPTPNSMTHFLQPPTQLIEAGAQNPAAMMSMTMQDTNHGYNLTAQASNGSPAHCTQDSPPSGHPGVPNGHTSPQNTFSAAQTTQASPQNVFGMATPNTQASPRFAFSGSPSSQQYTTSVVQNAQGTSPHDMGAVHNSQGSPPLVTGMVQNVNSQDSSLKLTGMVQSTSNQNSLHQVMGVIQNVNKQGSPPQATGVTQNLYNHRSPLHATGMTQSLNSHRSTPQAAGMSQSQQVPSPLTVQTSRVSPQHSMGLTQNSQALPPRDFGVSHGSQQAFSQLTSGASSSQTAQGSTQGGLTSARGSVSPQFRQTPRPLYQSCQISAMSSGGVW